MSESVKQEESKKSRRGKTNNPNGRPKTGQAMADVIRNFLAEPDEAEPKLLRMVRLTRHAYNQAMTDRPEAVRWADFLVDRAYGRPVSAIELTGPNGGPISVKNMTDAVLDEEIAKTEKALNGSGKIKTGK